MSTYVFEQAWERERERLESIEKVFDGNSTGRLTAVGVGPGWRCLEVGGGAGGVARWLADRVGPQGRVVATDLDPRFLRKHGRDNLDVWQHDIVSGPLDTDCFDLVHARAVLEHLPERQAVLARLISTLRPGGWLVVEDVDFAGVVGAILQRYTAPAAFAEVLGRVGRAVEQAFGAAGADAGFGARLPGVLREAGLLDVGTQLYTQVIPGGTPGDWVRLTFEQLGPRLIGAGLVSADDMGRCLAFMADPGTWYLPPVMVAAWGRRPVPDLPRLPGPATP